MSGGRLLVVGCGFPQLGLLRFARAEGLTVVGADANASAVGAPLCDEFAPASTVDVAALVAAGRAQRVDGITTCGSEAAVLPVSLAARELGLPFYATPEVLDGFRMKHDMRRLYAAADAPSPAFAVARSLAEVSAFVARVGLPVVVKPSRGWGQRGVAIVRTPDELADAAHAALDVARRASGSDGDAAAVIEEFVEGREFSVNAYTLEGRTQVLAVTERIITGYPDPPGITFAEAFPSQLDDDELARVADAAVRGAAALGVIRGPTYTQVRSGPRGARLIETAHRLGGGLDPDVTFLASGVSLYRKLVGVALGRADWESCGAETKPHGGAVGRFLCASPHGVVRPGRVAAVEGLEAARALPGVVTAEVYVSVGGVVEPLSDGSKRVGHVLACGASREEAEKNAAWAMAAIGIVTG